MTSRSLELAERATLEVSPASVWCQRWRHGTHRWRHRRDGGFDPAAYRVSPIDEQPAKRYVGDNHYLSSFPAAKLRYGIFEGPRLAGVAVLAVPQNQAVLTGVFPDLAPLEESLELARLVLADRVPANGETWFLGRVFRLAAKVGIRGVVSFADPVARRTATGQLLFPGHQGVVYQAKSAWFTGRSRASWILVTPDGAVLGRRSLAKVRNDECGHGYVEERLRGFGAPPRRPGESGDAWLLRALPAAAVTRLRHGGCYRYAFPLGRTRRERAAVRIGRAQVPYPKTIDDPFAPTEAA